MGDVLQARLYGRPVGDFLRGPRGEVMFRYDQVWMSEAAQGRGHALSISMPVTESLHGPEVANPFIAGLLPDSLLHRRQIADEFNLPDETDFELLRALGKDCAGAVTIVDPDEPAAPHKTPSLRRLDDAELADILRTLPHRPLNLEAGGGMRLSLAGVNDKLGVTVTGGVVCLPQDGFPSSHIIKTDIRGLSDSIRTEHFCLKLAGACGIATPRSSLHQAEDMTYMRISRYDRRLVQHEGRPPVLARTHQEDFCQALAVAPGRKYEVRNHKDEGPPGPSWADAFNLVKLTERPAVDTAGMLDRALFQYLSGNPDAHAKNYSLRYAPYGAIALSPLYDLNNQYAFRDIPQFKNLNPLMAMKIGGEIDPTKVTREHFKAFADDVGLQASQVLRRLDEMAEKISTSVVALRDQARNTVTDTRRLDFIVEDVLARADDIRNNRPSGLSAQAALWAAPWKLPEPEPKPERVSAPRFPGPSMH